MLTYDMDAKEKNKVTGRRIRLAREAKGWGQDELAAEVGVKPATVSRWESGSFPSRIGLPTIAKALDKTVEWLQDGEPLESRADDAIERIGRLEKELSALKAPSINSEIDSLKSQNKRLLVENKLLRDEVKDLKAAGIALAQVFEKLRKQVGQPQSEAARPFLRNLRSGGNKP